MSEIVVARMPLRAITALRRGVDRGLRLPAAQGRQLLAGADGHGAPRPIDRT